LQGPSAPGKGFDLNSTEERRFGLWRGGGGEIWIKMLTAGNKRNLRRVVHSDEKNKAALRGRSNDGQKDKKSWGRWDKKEMKGRPSSAPVTEPGRGKWTKKNWRGR